MINEINDRVAKSKLKITVKALSKTSDWSRVTAKQTNKQTQRHRNRQTFRQINILKEQKNTLTDNNTDTRTEKVKQKIKNEAPYVLLLLK